MIKAVIFDLDGTLITIEERFYRVFIDTLKKYTRNSIKQEELSERFTNNTVNNFLTKAGLLNDEVDKFWSDFLLAYRQAKYWKISKLIEGAKKTLKDLKDKGLKLALITGGITNHQ